MAAAITGIDHTLIGVRDLEAARTQYQRLGFAITPRGSHVGWGTANYCIMFERDYIELIGLVDPSRYSHNLDKFLAVREGLMNFAFAGDAAQAAEFLRAHGIGVGDGLTSLSRRLELPEGTVMPRFALCYPAPDAFPGLNAFICQHLTPELLRRPEWLRHPNGARAIASLTMIAANPGGFAAAYERLFGAAAVTATPGRLVVGVGSHEIIFHDPASRAGSVGGPPLLPGITPPYLAAMTLVCADPAASAAWLTTQKIPFTRESDGSLLLAPAATCGVWLRLAPPA